MVATPGPAGSLPREARWIVFGALAAFLACGVFMAAVDSPARALVGGVLAAAATAWAYQARREWVLVASAAVAAGVLVFASGRSVNVAWFAVCMLTSWCVLTGRRRDGLVYWIGALILFGAQYLFVEPDPGWAAWAAGTTFAFLGAALILHELRLLAELSAAQAGLVETARAEERSQIARELHDVIAHSLTVSLMHVTSARVALEYAPDDAERSLAEAERIGQQTLAEVRGTVGLLRRDGETAELKALPGVRDLPGLIDGYRLAGAQIAYTAGDLDDLKATTGLGVYRIAQEALTNAAKHAAGSPVDVRLAADVGWVTLTVDSGGTPGSGTGLGLMGMRERAESLGGSCEAGPAGAGWRVSARLPVTS